MCFLPVPQTRRGFTGDTGRVTPQLTQPTRFQHVRSAAFALVFAPVGLSLMNLSLVSILAATAVGQPLSASAGMVGIVLAAVLFCLIAINSEESAGGMIALTAWSAFIGLLHMQGVSPAAVVLPLRSAEITAALHWNYFPYATTAVFGGMTIAMYLVRRAATHSELSAEQLWDSLLPSRRHYRERSRVFSATIVAITLAIGLYIYMAPMDSSGVAAHGLTGMQLGHEPRPYAGILAALLLGAVAVMTRWSSLGPQVAIWVFMVIPAYIIVPVWASLTGQVVTPGLSPMTALQMATPVVMALGLTLAAVAVGPLLVRRNLRRSLRASLLSQQSDSI